MHPTLLRYGPFFVASYTVCSSLGFLLLFAYIAWQADRQGLDARKISTWEILILVSGVAGAKLLDGWLVGHGSLSLSNVFTFWLPSGRTFYGGLLLALAVSIAYCRMAGLPVARCADLAAPGMALGLAAGRVGCFLAGCCYGAPSELPWCLTVPIPGVPLVARHPTQLYECFGLLLMFWLLHRYHERRDRVEGLVMIFYLYSYSVLRFLVEIVRADERGDTVLGVFSSSQWIGMALFLGAAVTHRRLTKQSPARTAGL